MMNWNRLIQVCFAVAVVFTPLTLFAFESGGRLGPTGLAGSVFRIRRGQPEKGIKVTNVAKGSPADGKIRKNDEIIGVNNAKFTGDPRRAIAAAIDVAETVAAGGKLTLILKGNKKVVLTLPVLGSYSATAPYKCPKTDKIISQIAESLLKSKHAGGGATRSGILGLMATGEKKHFDAAAKMVKGLTKIDPKQVDALLRGEIDMGYVGWYWGYNLIALGEYYLLSKDKSVLPAIRTYALGLARGQDGGGIWGHRMATTGNASRSRNGRLPGYAQINQPSLTCFMGMIIAKNCGINDPTLDKAIAKTYANYSNYIGKGALGYGVGSGTSRYFNNNGTSGSAAVCMALKKNSNGARFFSQMAATSYDGLESGHASAFFNPLWTTLGANVSGPKVTQQFFRKSLWYHNLRRRWDGGYGGDSWGEGPEGGVALLIYCLPRKKLLITGRNADESNWLKREKATEVVMMSKMSYGSKSNAELMDLVMNSPFPHIVRRASWTLLKELPEERRKELIPKWAAYLKTGTDKQKALALSQYGSHTPLNEKRHLLKDIGAILRDNNVALDVRVMAATSLGCHFKELAYPYYMDIVKLIAQDRPNDPFGDVDVALGRALNSLCTTPFSNRLVPDKEVFYKAANKLLSYKRDKVSVDGAKMLSDMPLKDFHRVGDRILHIATNEDPTAHSYHGLHAVRASITLLARLNIEEGIHCLENGFKRGRYNNEVKMIFTLLPEYGGNARQAVDALEKKKPEIKKGRFGKDWLKAAKAIREDKNPKKLITFKEAIQAGKLDQSLP